MTTPTVIKLPEGAYNVVRETMLWMDAKPEFINFVQAQIAYLRMVIAEEMEQADCIEELHKYQLDVRVDKSGQIYAVLKNYNGETKVLIECEL